MTNANDSATNKDRNKRIHEFATVQTQRFRNLSLGPTELAGDSSFAEACFSLGFRIDEGAGLKSEFSEDVYKNWQDLNLIVTCINDIDMLGTAIFSKWQEFHFAPDSGESIILPSERTWFLLCLARLAVLASPEDGYLYAFDGHPRKMTLVSQIDTMVYQQIAVHEKGDVYVSLMENREKKISRRFRVDKARTAEIMASLGRYFAHKYNIRQELHAEHPENTVKNAWWTLTITNDKDRPYRAHATLFDAPAALCAISDMLRKELNMPNLLAFDGNAKPDRIEKLQFLCQSVRKEADSAETQEYIEQLRMFREGNGVEVTQTPKAGLSCTRNYSFHTNNLDYFDVVAALDECFSLDLLHPQKDVAVPKQPGENSREDFVITIDYLYAGKQMYAGKYNAAELPKDFRHFRRILQRLLADFPDIKLFL